MIREMLRWLFPAGLAGRADDESLSEWEVELAVRDRLYGLRGDEDGGPRGLIVHSPRLHQP